jgi:mannobiose 2-epimerase
MDARLKRLHDMAKKDLTGNLLPWWMEHGIDEKNGGFLGRVDCNDVPDPEAPRFIVLSARLVWTFSAAYRVLGDERYLKMAKRAYDYLIEHFRDREYGGYYTWVDCHGNVTDAGKHIYGNAFALYGLSEYARATGDKEALKYADEQAHILERAWDPMYKGYYEAMTRDWEHSPWLHGVNRFPTDEKTMNTHLHLIEAFTCNLRVNDTPFIRNRVRQLLYIMLNRIVNSDIHHFHCFQDRQWNPTSSEISYGHDIEGSWLMMETAEVLGEEEALRKTRDICVNMARAVLEEGLTDEGALMTEYDPVTGHRSDALSWWEQNESVVGFLNAFELTGDEKFLDASLKSFDYINEHFIDRKNGGWHPILSLDGIPMTNDKLNGFTCPYHNSRMSMEVIERTGRMR